MDCLTKLYERDFSRPVGEWCRKHGVEYIGHVVEDNSVHSRLGLGAGHWFRAMAGQDMAGIDAIGGQIVYGAPVQERKGMVEGDGEFFHYALGKMGASAGHLDPMKKGRTMCELFGAYGWNFGVRNMKYLLDHLLTKGINYLVPHAFSMAEYPDIDCPPHFYAGGNNPEFPWFVQLMKYANRMCNLLNGGTHAVSAAVLYDGEADWTGERMPMQKICRQLTQGQIEFDIVCLDMLDDLEAYHGSVTDGKLQINHVMFDALLIPYAEYLPQKLLRFHQKSEQFTIYFVGGYPQKVLCDEVRETVTDVHWPEIGKVISIEQIMPEMIKMGLNRVSLHPAFPQMNMYHYQKDGQIVMLQNESAEQTFSGTVLLPFQRDAIYYDGYEDVYYDNEGERGVNGLAVHIELAPGESCVLLEKGDQVCRGNYRSLREQKKQCEHQMDLSENWKVSWVKAKEYPCWQQEETEKILRPFSEAHPNFSGIIRYEKEIELSEITTEAFLELENVYEVVKVVINGKEAGMKLTPPYLIKIGKYLRAGKNEIILEAATTPGRDQLNYLQPSFDFSHEAMEPAGIYGKIKLNYR
jgi:hypothetical protein